MEVRGCNPSGEGYEGLGLFVHGFHEGDIWAIGCREPLRESLDFPAASMHWRSTTPAYGLLVVPTYFEGRETFPLTFFLPKMEITSLSDMLLVETLSFGSPKAFSQALPTSSTVLVASISKTVLAGISRCGTVWCVRGCG